MTNTTILPTPIVIPNDVPDFAPSFVAPSGGRAWDLADIRLGDDVRIEHDVWQRDDVVYGSTRAVAGHVHLTALNGSHDVHIHTAEAVIIDRRCSTTILQVTLADGSKVSVFLHGEHGNAVEITEA